MDKLTASRINGGNTAYERVESDFYPTPPEPTIALMNFLQLPKDVVIWEPACGKGDMSSVIRNMGYTVKESDIQFGDDFLECPFFECDWIITNPPFSLAEKFVRRCCEHKRPFAFLLKCQYWHAKKRLSLFDETHPSYILPLTWRVDFLKKKRGKGAPPMDVMWVVWDTEYSGKYPLYIPLEKPTNL